LGRAVRYGVYDLAANSGWVSVGVDHDTAAFAVNSIRQWWLTVGRARYPQASRLLITADGGGSNGSRVRLWKRELQKLANELGLDIVVSHLPPGTSKWNKIEHRLFSFISQNWRAKPLVSFRVIVELISATTTKTGLPDLSLHRAVHHMAHAGHHCIPRFREGSSCEYQDRHNVDAELPLLLLNAAGLEPRCGNLELVLRGCCQPVTQSGVLKDSGSD
jgi:hypothetical protein